MTTANLLQLGLVVYIVVLLFTLRKILLQIKSPSKTLSWLLFVSFIPIIGILIYRFLGRSPRKDRLFQQKKPFYNTSVSEIDRDKIPLHKENLITLLYKNNSASISYYNDVEVLNDGPETFSALFTALENAKSSIHLDFYIVEEGEILDKLLRLLEKKIKQGVDVRLLYDGFGSFSLNKKYKSELTRIGVDHHKFMPFNVFAYFDYLNYRNHRKIIIIDNLIAFTGGMNISDKYTHDDPINGLWHDTFIKLRGPAALDFEKIFKCDWFYAQGKSYELGDSPVVDNQKGNIAVQVIGSGPDSQYRGIMQEYFTIITDAEDYVYIVTPYFVPGEAILTALKTAALSGIDVRLMLPYTSDSKWLKWSMFTFLEELLSAGVRIYLHHDGFLHSKVIISDDIISSVGTANVDARSFDTNFEVNAVVYDKDTTLHLKDYFLEDIKSCEELALQSFPHRHDRNKFMEAIARLSSPML